MLNIIIVDDNQDAISALSSIINLQGDDFKIVETTTNPVQGIELINRIKPDIVFLDVEMPIITGFELLEKVIYRDFKVIFTTAFDHYAIGAIRSNAIDYILKPVSITDVRNALKRVQDKNNSSKDVSGNFNQFLDNVKQSQSRRIKIPTLKGFEFIFIDEIVYLEAEGTYTKIQTSSDENILVSKPLKEMDGIVSSANFFRTHRSFVVNMDFMKRFDREKNEITLLNDSKIPLSRRRLGAFKEFVDKIT